MSHLHESDKLVKPGMGWDDDMNNLFGKVCSIKIYANIKFNFFLLLEDIQWFKFGVVTISHMI